MLSTRRLVLIILLLALILLFLVVPGVSWADSRQDAARALARKIAGATGAQHSVTLSVRNLSSLPDAEVSAVSQALELELRAAGLRLSSKPNGAVQVRVTLSSNLQGDLWIAEISTDEAPKIEFHAVERANHAERRDDSTITLAKELFWSQDAPILSLRRFSVPSEKNPLMGVLEKDKVSIYVRGNRGWELNRAFPITTSRPWPRDLRGQLSPDHVTPAVPVLGVVLPGAGCQLTFRENLKNADWKCREGDKLGWFVFAGNRLVDAGAEFTPSRNFFTGQFYDVETGRATEKVEPFFSAASLSERSSEQAGRAYTGVDGQLRWYDTRSHLVAAYAGWGSELTSMQSNCGAGRQLLVTQSADWSEPDAVVALELRGRDAVRVSAPLALPGPVTSLEPFDDGMALAVVRNLNSGRYEAYTLTLSCGR